MKLLWSVIALVCFTACGGFNDDYENSIRNSTDYDCADPQCRMIFPVTHTRTDQIINQRQIVPSFAKCLKMTSTQITKVTLDTQAEVQGVLSPTGNVNEISSSMLMSVAKIAGQVCLDLVNTENAAGARLFFDGYNLAVGGAAGSGNYLASVSKIAKACWARDINPLEKKFFEALKTAGTVNTDRKGAHFLCTLMLSTPSAVLF